VNQIKFKYVHFKQEYFSFIDAILQDAGIKNDDFSMIQWRGEAMKLDFVTCANHIVTARNIMNAAARTNSTPFVQGRAIEHVLNRKLVFDYCAYKKQAYSLCPCDLKGCYDRIVHLAASLALQRIGISQAKITSMFGTIQQVIHKIRTVFGDSQDSYGGTSDNFLLPPQGVGQGNGGGPSIWAILSSTIFFVLREKGFGVNFCSALTNKLFGLCRFAYADDCDLIQAGDNPIQVSADMQSALSTWEGIVQATGGSLAPDKSWLYL